MPELDDITLLKQNAGGDESAFTALFERHVHLVYSAALRQTRRTAIGGPHARNREKRFGGVE